MSIIKQFLTSLVTLGCTDRKWLCMQRLFMMLLKRVTMTVMVNLLVMDLVIVKLESDCDFCECCAKLLPDSVDLTQK